MKCPECDGVGRIHYGEEWCSACNGTGEIQTNEEWLRQCTTEQLAEFLYDIRYDYQIPWKNKEVVEWLKQPHAPFS